MTLSEVLSDFGLRPDVTDIPSSAYEAAKKLLLDATGCAIAGQQEPGVRQAVEQAEAWGGKKEATIIGRGTKVPAPNAVFANAAMTHALDYDDVYIPGTLHITSIIVPIMLAAQEMSETSGKKALAAMIMGIEVAGRLSMAERGRRRGMGFLPTSLAGSFGAVLTVARLLGLDRRECVNAMGINYAQVSGNRQALLDSTLTKRMQPGFAARSALWSTTMAARGVTGPERALDGEAGYFSVYMNGDAPEAEELTKEREWLQVERVAIKRWPSCGACHHAQAAAEKLREEEDLRPEQIAGVELFGCGPGGLVGNPFRIGENPQVDAQFSVAWGVAHTLLRGPASLRDYTNENVRDDTEVAEFANEIAHIKPPDEMEPIAEQPLDYPDRSRYPQGLVVHLQDGRRLVRRQCPCQTFAPGNATFKEIVQKFKDCAEFSGNFPPDRTDQIVDLIDRFEKVDDVRQLMALLTAEGN